jgi:hypothetical protein
VADQRDDAPAAEPPVIHDGAQILGLPPVAPIRKRALALAVAGEVEAVGTERRARERRGERDERWIGSAGAEAVAQDAEVPGPRVAQLAGQLQSLGAQDRHLLPLERSAAGTSIATGHGVQPLEVSISALCSLLSVVTEAEIGGDRNALLAETGE